MGSLRGPAAFAAGLPGRALEQFPRTEPAAAGNRIHCPAALGLRLVALEHRLAALSPDSAGAQPGLGEPLHVLALEGPLEPPLHPPGNETAGGCFSGLISRERSPH